MLVFDAHIDTLSRLLMRGEDLQEAKGHVSLAKLKQGKVGAQFFAAFVHPNFYHGLALHRTLEMIDLFWQILAEHSSDLGYAAKGTDIPKLQDENKLACFLAVEGGEALEGKLANLRIFYRLGVRLLTLTWNHRNELGAGQLEGIAGGGLSSFGVQVVQEMNRLGMLIDVSHINEPGFWDVLKISNQPVLASHSNARALCDHPRNLTDEQIRALAEQGGVIGVNFYPYFLASSGQATIEDVVAQIRYLVNVGGINAVALGSDFDGINSTPKGLNDCSKMKSLIPALENAGFKTGQIEQIMGGNLSRLCRQVLG